MRIQYNTVEPKLERKAICPATDHAERGQLEVNVIYTNTKATAAALKSAVSMARDLGASIQLTAVIAVPLRLPLNQPPVSISFVEKLLAKLVTQQPDGPVETSVHLFLCRDHMETLLQVLRPDSLVIVGGRKHWWPTVESRMAKALRLAGHRVVFVSSEKVEANASGN